MSTNFFVLVYMDFLSSRCQLYMPVKSNEGDYNQIGIIFYKITHILTDVSISTYFN